MGRICHYNDITNITTGLMGLRDIGAMANIPINVHVEEHWIHVIVGFGTPFRKDRSFYFQDMYRYFKEKEEIYDFIEEAIQEINKKRC